jgi:hypothetical protein
MVRSVRTGSWSWMMICVGLVALPTTSNAQRKNLGPVEQSNGGPCDTAEWKLVFHDEFLGTTLDRNKWVDYFTYSVDGSDQCEGCRVMGGTNSIFRNEQVSLAEGKLSLGVVERTGTWYGRTMGYESGMVHSIGKAKFTYGRFEVRCRIPAGQGLWPAFWGFGGETEIDAFEFCGERPQWMKGSLHRWGPTKFSHTGKHRSKDLSKDFHTYAVEWEQDELRWYLDGELVHSRGRFVDRRGRPLPGCDRAPGSHATAPYFPRSTDALSIIINLAVSEPKGYCKGPKGSASWPVGTALEVDHVRVYQRRPQTGFSDLCNDTRRLTPSDANAAPMRPEELRNFELSGAPGKIQWTASPGLRIIRKEGNTVTVEVLRGMKVPQWLRAEVVDEPCSSGALAPWITVPVMR